MAYRIIHRNTELEAALADERARYWRGKPPDIRRRIAQAFLKLEASPLEMGRSHQLQHNLKGLRSMDLGKNWRLLFKVCEECRREGWGADSPLPCCTLQEWDPTAVNVVDLRKIH